MRFAPTNIRITCYTIIIVVIVLFTISQIGITLANAQVNNSQNVESFQNPLPKLKDPKLKVEIVADNLSFSTGIAILDNHHILTLKRYSSGFSFGGVTTVNLVTNGKLQDKPVLSILSGLCDNKNPQPHCSVFNERGLLGIATRKVNSDNATLGGSLKFFFITLKLL